MAQYLAANNAATTTSGSITSTSTAIPLLDGAAFPSPTGGAYTLVTLEDALGVREIVCVVGRSTNVLTVGIPGSASANVLGRNYESILGMTAANWASGSIISCRPTASLVAAGANAASASFVANTPAGTLVATTVQAALNELDTEKAPIASPTFTGTVTGATGVFSGAVTTVTAAAGTSDTTVATTAFVDALRDVSTSTNTTLALTDRGKSVDVAAGVTIPANGAVAFPIGTVVVITNTSATPITITISSDTLRFAGTATTGTRTLAGYGLATIRKVAATTWYISGAGLS